MTTEVSDGEEQPITPRIPPASPPYPDRVGASLDALTRPGEEPLTLFTTLASDERLFERFTAGGLLDRGHLSLRQRELAIDRITALCGSEYEWGVHVSLFGERAGLTDGQIASLLAGGGADDCWTEEEACLLDVCDEVDRTSSLCPASWERARRHFEALAILELLMLCGFYRMVSYVTNGLALQNEQWAARFADHRL